MKRLLSLIFTVVLTFSAVNFTQHRSSLAMVTVANNEVAVLASGLEYSYIGGFSEGLAPVRISGDGNDNTWGFIDETGTLVLTLKGIYRRIIPFVDGLAAVETTSQSQTNAYLWGYIDKTGKIVIAPQYQWAKVFFNDGVAYVGNEHAISSLIDRTGAYILDPEKWSWVHRVDDGLICAGKRGEPEISGLFDAKGQIVLEPAPRDYCGFSNGLAMFDNYDGTYTFYDKTGKVVKTLSLPYDAYEFINDVIVIYDDVLDKYGIVDMNGMVIVSAIYDEIAFESGIDSDYLFHVCDHYNGYDKTGIIDKTGKIIVPIEYDAIELFYGMAVVSKDDGQCALYNASGKNIIPFGEYDGIEVPNDKMLIVYKSGQCALLNKDGDVIFQLGEYDLISALDLDNELVSACDKNGKWSIFRIIGNGVDPDDVEDIILRGIVFEYGNGTKTDDAVANGNCYLNLTTETLTLPDDYTVAAYSIDGGKKWKKGELPTGTKFNKLFDKSFTLLLSDDWNNKDIREDGELIEKKGVPEDATVIKFPAINARPKANSEKLAAYYADETWTLMTKASNAVPEMTYEFVKGASNGKLPDGDLTWQPVPNGGFDIISKPAKGDKTKNVYYFRSAATFVDGEYTPASKTFKISPAYFGNTTKYKIDYKKELLKLKNGDSYSIDGGISWIDVTDKSLALAVEGYITGGTDILAKKASNGRKPRTDIQTIAPVERATMTSIELTCSNGKITTNLKDYEVLIGQDSKGNPKWGKVPKVKENSEFEIRVKATAKLSKNVWTGNAASVACTLKITYGEYAEEKEGIIAAEIMEQNSILSSLSQFAR